MSKTIKHSLLESYLNWLEQQLRDEHGNPDKTYWELLQLMFEKEFTWSVPMDDNRLQDARDLRTEFAHRGRRSEQRKQETADALQDMAPVSFLEVLIALSQKMAFSAGGSAPGWAWHFLNNLELHRMFDPLTGGKRRRANEIMDTVINRTYLPNGEGSFFPLAWPDEDMTRIELWYQMNYYISELHPEF